MTPTQFDYVAIEKHIVGVFWVLLLLWRVYGCDPLISAKKVGEIEFEWEI